MAVLDPVVGPPPPTIKPGSKGDCRTEYAPRPSRDPNPMCAIDGGTFMMGDENGPAGKPVKTDVADFYIDQFEVTVAQAAHFLNTHGGWCGGVACYHLGGNEIEGEWKVRPGMANRPMDFYGNGAAYYCAWVGKRLPTEAEWEYAARHDPRTGRDYKYAWGDRWEKKRANCDDALCEDEFLTPLMAPVGTFDGTGGYGDGTSPWGLHDVVGNAEEVVEGCGPQVECVDPERCKDRPPCQLLVKGLAFVSDPRSAWLTSREGRRSGAVRCAMDRR